jgi:hypothetical protein
MMLRTTAGWSLTFVLVLGGIVACSSKSTDEGTGTGGNGSIVGGSSTGGTTATGTGGTATAAGGTATATGGTASATGGTASATGGTATGLCADTAITCVDATNASSCNPDTGKIETFNCVDEAKAIGIVSSGCAKDALNGDSCALDSFTDQACADGTGAFSYCENATTDEQVFNIYVNCFLDNMDGHTIIPCFSQYVTMTMKTSQDCVNAEDACFGAVGAGGAPAMTGTGGAP